MIKFHAPKIDQAANQLASHIPDGRAWAAKNLDGTNMRALISGCAAAFMEIQKQIETMAREFDISLTDQLLPDWEKSCGLPEECIGVLGDIEERRSAVILRLRKIPFVTKEEYEQLAFDLTGLDVTVTPGADIELFPLEFPCVFSSGNSFFKLYVYFNDTFGGFPYSFPFPFLIGPSNIVECVFKQIVPANVLLVFRSSPTPEPDPLLFDGSWMMDGTYTLSGKKITA